MKRCFGCMELYDDSKYQVCPHCGYTEGNDIGELIHLKHGTILNNRYIIGRVIGYGGFGVTYLAWDGQLESRVAIKEYMPSEFSTRMPNDTQLTFYGGDKDEQFGDGKKKFLDEARRLAEFSHEDGVVTVFDSFEENDTAYIVMEYLDGETLDTYLKHVGTIPEDDAVELLMPVMKSLENLHSLMVRNTETGEDENVPLLHRDISPDNIFITKKGDVKLIDFGASRYATTSHSRSLTVLVKPGYSPEEQYRSRGDQGKYTDVYSLAATLYKMITGVTPPDAMERRAMYENRNKDILKDPHTINRNISRNREVAILNAMNVEIESRTPDVGTFIEELEADPPAKRVYGRIKKIDLYNWPTWLRVAIPAVGCVLLTLIVMLATGIIKISGLDAGKIEIPDGIVQVPNVLNKDLGSATDTLEDAGLIVIQGAGEKTSYVEEGLVVLQEPMAGYYVEYSSNIVIHTAYSDEVKEAVNGMSTVPFVLSLDYDTARQRLETAGLICEREDVEDEYMDKGLVCGIYASGKQISENTELEKGTLITLYVSKGPKSVSMPNVLGMTYDEARVLLKEYGISVIQTGVESTKYSVGCVAAQSIASGSSVKKGDTVTLSVVSEKASSLVSVPSVTGLKQSEAENTLESLGFVVNVLTNKDNKVEKDYVISQTPRSGSSLEKGSTVTIIVSEGSSLVSVPSVTGLKQSEAVNKLESLGFMVNVYTTKDNNVAKGYVISQTPESGSSLEKGSAVTITVSEGKAQEPMYTLTFDPNGGSTPLSSKSLKKGESYGSLPTPTRSYYSFAGWYTSSGSRVSESTVMEATDVTVYAQWSENSESSWVEASSMPSDASVTAEKWVYYETEWITSSTPDVSGYTVDDSKTETKTSESSGSWSEWSTDPVYGSDTRTVETKTETVATGQQPSSYDLVEYNYMGTNGNRYYRIDDIGSNYSAYGYSSSYGKFGRWHTLSAADLSYCATVGPGGYMGGKNGGYNDCSDTGYVVDHPNIDGSVIMFVYNVNYETTYSDVTYYRYMDKTVNTEYIYYLYKREQKESESEVCESDTISDVVHYVKYISK